MTIQNKQILKASKNFEKVHSTFKNNNKFRFLPNWLEKESNLFLSETQNTSKSYNVLKRGSLIFVDFGINIGSELSNRHWAVVLNKNDSPKSRNLTVLPISSKEKKFSVMIDEVIQQKSKRFLLPILDKIGFDYFSIIHYALTEITPFDLGSAEEIYQEFLIQYGDAYNSESAKEIYDNGAGMEKVENTNRKLKDLVNHYQRFNKISYAKCDQIKTISKDRIIYINELDPCGKIKVSDETLDRIDEKLKELYLKN
ncbi:MULTISPECIES: type II toxin-antitoxin system PemK/MazF family toxin [Streptococcus]|uniref:Phage protein n=2 Tax=Streptococcus TaxID=1301 RepID=A0A0U0CP01_9STRE|nr:MULTISPECIES: type II toxin-antitoxin system PemK/MazF family toxin [Streptococcus]MCQ2810281.1 type II toxin-antitoxin system PemK/MazF family toxin [Helicobacter pylori]MDS5726053.1 type II toxin-antitoxin system PemK/MazF family toxin [Streptococcus pneumoniae]AEL11236.1 phage protein [Streptococcus pseudopneumoniae IS7493]EID27480.1 PemK-like domain protein [Streptococcus pseudopneumoniae ATCC BAA-960 = CCUG 49455]ETD95593.1 growth inhibitor PemK [Streptococcus pseudopneumoniae 1321]